MPFFQPVSSANLGREKGRVRRGRPAVPRLTCFRVQTEVLRPPAEPDAWSRWKLYFLAGYDRRSLVALALLIVVGAAVGYRWSDLLDVNGRMDWLLAGTWVFMAALLTWDVSARRDAVMLAVGFVGGGVIEWPAWPIATLAIERLSRLLDRAIDEPFASRGGARKRWFGVAYLLAVPSFVVWMSVFARHTFGIFATQAVIALMVAITLLCSNPRRDVTIFVAGSFLGIFLEYWGTSRECWTYYTHEVPPLVAIVAHGFAAVAFARGADWVNRSIDAVVMRSPAGQVAGDF
jgi:hypothetical protein